MPPLLHPAWCGIQSPKRQTAAAVISMKESCIRGPFTIYYTFVLWHGMVSSEGSLSETTQDRQTAPWKHETFLHVGGKRHSLYLNKATGLFPGKRWFPRVCLPCSWWVWVTLMRIRPAVPTVCFFGSLGSLIVTCCCTGWVLIGRVRPGSTNLPVSFVGLCGLTSFPESKVN